MPEKLSKSGNPLGPIGTKVLFENEHIRVWSVELGPRAISRCMSTSIPTSSCR